MVNFLVFKCNDKSNNWIPHLNTIYGEKSNLKIMPGIQGQIYKVTYKHTTHKGFISNDLSHSFVPSLPLPEVELVSGGTKLIQVVSHIKRKK